MRECGDEPQYFSEFVVLDRGDYFHACIANLRVFDHNQILNVKKSVVVVSMCSFIVFVLPS
jgi:hypothetical protein